MSRRSIDSRMDRIMDKLLPPDSFERRAYYLPPELREALLTYRRKVEAMISRAENLDGPGGAYARMIDGELTLPAMPTALRDALALDDMVSLAPDATADEAAEAWNGYCGRHNT